MNILTENQIRILRLVSRAPLLKDNFFLTGGTALSEFYLQHRYSEDLDLFTSNEKIIANASVFFTEILAKGKIDYKIVRMMDTFSELHIYLSGETIKMDFALESPFRLQKVQFNEGLGIFIDNELDISCNKLSALFDRADPKDFADVFFVNKFLIPIETLIASTQKKHIGMDNYWLARAFFKVQDIAFLPRMIKSLDMDELKSFFLSYSEKLMKL